MGEVIMELSEYFENTKGVGVLSTADSNGQVDSAIYSRPHFMEDGTLAFIMRNRLSYKNIQSNPNAAYMFIEDGEGYKGKRLYLTRIREEQDAELIASMSRRQYRSEQEKEAERVLVIFKLEKERPLVGDA
jgi:Pyridoxamine 5'-phosphate oxidase